MGELIDKTKGNIKETTGEATGDRELERQGKMDKAKGEVKEGWEDLKQGVKDAVHSDRSSERR